MRNFLLLLVLATPVFAEPPAVVVVPPAPPVKWTKFDTDVCKQLTLSVGDKATWARLSEGCDLAVDSDGKSATFSAGKAGVYRLTASTATGTAFIAVTVGNPGPDVVPVPPPVDTLTPKLKEAYATDKGTHDDALKLAALYTEAVKLAADPTVPTSAELMTRVRVASSSMVGPEILKGVRNVAAAEISAVLGMSSNDPITDAQRSKAAAVFSKLAAILEGF